MRDEPVNLPSGELFSRWILRHDPKSSTSLVSALAEVADRQRYFEWLQLGQSVYAHGRRLIP
jgi:hypothetical protein